MPRFACGRYRSGIRGNSMVAAYVVVQGTEPQYAAKPNTSTESDFAFSLPSDYVPQPPNARRAPRAVLQFMAHPSEPEDEFQFKFFINGSEVYKYGPSTEDIVRSFIVVFDQGFLHAGSGNELKIKRGGGTGALGLSSVVIWYNDRTTATTAPRKSAASKTAPKRTARKQTKRPPKKGGKYVRR